MILSNDAPAAAPSVYGGSVTVTWTATSTCETTTASSTFTVPPCDASAFATLGVTNKNSTCFLKDGFDRWGWTNAISKAGTYTMPLYIGAADCDPKKGKQIGTVVVTYSTKGALSVKYTLNNVPTTAQKYAMTEAHLYVGCTKYPLDNGMQTVAPGQYTINQSFATPATDFTVNFKSVSGTFYVIAHAFVKEVPSTYPLTRVTYTPNPVTYTCIGQTGTKSATVSDVILQACEVTVYPNPFRNIVNFSIVMLHDSHVRLEIYNQSGSLVKVIFNANLMKGDAEVIRFDASKYPHSVFIYRLIPICQHKVEL